MSKRNATTLRWRNRQLGLVVHKDPHLLAVTALLTVSLLGKSQLAHVSTLTWRLQMFLTVMVSLVSLWFVFVRATASPRQVPARQLSSPLLGVLLAFLIVGVMSSLLQPNVMNNMAYATVYAGVVLLLFLSPCRSAAASKYHYIRALTYMLLIMTGADLLAAIPRLPWATVNQRFSGLHHGPIVAGQMLGLAAVFFLWRALADKSRLSRLWWFAFGADVVMLLMTRTRGSVFACTISCVICLVFMYGRVHPAKRGQIAFNIGVLVLLAAVSVIGLSRQDDLSARISSYLRIGKTVRETTSSRAQYWRAGAGFVNLSNVLGYGPLARYRGELSVEQSTYDRDSNPHNGILSAFQALGWLGGSLYVMLWIVLGLTYLRARHLTAVLGLSVLVFGAGQSVGENWLLSFGSPVDLFSWVLLGCAVCGSANRAKSSKQSVAGSGNWLEDRGTHDYSRGGATLSHEREYRSEGGRNL